MKNVEKMGRRKLAYMVRKFNDGNYVLLTVEAGGAVVLKLERRLRVSEPVIKFITVRIDEEEKRLAKVKALRGTRRKLSAEPAAAPDPPVSAPVHAAPAEAAEPSSERLRVKTAICRQCRARSGFRLSGRTQLSRPRGLGEAKRHEDTQWLKRLLVRRTRRAHPQDRKADKGPDRVRDRDKALGRARDRAAVVPVQADAPAADLAGVASFSVARRFASLYGKIDAIPYRDVRLLPRFVAERGKIVPRRLTGVCTTHSGA